jgi:ribonuclease P protein component
MEPSDRSYRLPGRCRLSGRQQFAAVYAAKLGITVGPLTVRAQANGLEYSRLGLSVARRVGTAVVRNHIKRLLREAFRLSRHDWPVGYDLVVVVRPHPPAALADYQRMLFAAVRSIHVQYKRRAQSQD